MEKITFSWRESITHTYEEITTQIISFAPQLIGAIALLIAGWIIAKTLGVASRKLVGSFDSLFQRVAQTDGARQEKIKRSYAVIVSKVVFWTVMIFFISAAANTLGWQMFSSWMNSIVIYLPNLITGLLIILGGFLLGNGVKSVVINAAHSAGIEQGQFLARVVQIVILFTTLVIGIEQIGINVIFLTNVLVVTVGVFLSGAALAFGLGARTLVANIIGGQYVRKHCRVGEQMRLGAVEGNLVEVTQTSIILDTESGRTVIPAKYFQEQVSSFISNRKDSSEKSAASSPKGIKMINHKIDLALAFLQSQPGSAAAVLEQQPADYVSEFLKDVPYTHAAAVLRKMLPQYAARICKNLDPAISASFLSKMEVSLVAAIMRHSDKGLNDKIFELLPERTKIACKLLLTYADDVVGAWMVANITTLPDDCTVGEALSRLASNDTVINSDAVHIVDRERKLQGLVSVINLLRASASTPVSKIMMKKCDAISGRTALISAANNTVWAHQDTVAVINRNNQMVGVLRHTDLRKGLDGISSTITASSGNDPLTGLYEVYGRSLLALFSTISEAASPNRR